MTTQRKRGDDRDQYGKRIPTGPSLQGLYWAVEPPRVTARPEKKRARKAQKLARKANRSRK